MLKKISIFGFYIVWGYSISAQIQTKLPNVMLPSPTAMQFQRYGDYPVNNFTGIPSISIPLFTISEGDIEVPITLNYHASGCKSDDVSGFVGLGWTLNVGGMLTRTVQGFPDETKSFMIPAQPAQNLNWSDEPVALLLDELDEGIMYDHEYDIWNYNFLGKSAKYIFAQSGAFALDKSSLKLSGVAYNILDEKGLEYSFGPEGIEFTEYSDPVSSFTKNAATAFPLNAIKSAIDPNNIVSFSYQQGQNFVINRYYHIYSIDDWWDDNLSNTSENFANSRIWGESLELKSYLMKNYTSFISQIFFRSGSVRFNLDASTKMLNSIEVLNGSSQVIKKIVLNITPFPSAYSGFDPLSSSKLQSITVTDALNNTNETYSFNYFRENFQDAKPTPFQLNTPKDYWGFYNGDNGQTSRISQYSGFMSRDEYGPPFYINIGGNAIKTPSEYYTKTYVLDKITYPTGGYTVFDYEGNKNSSNVPVGGLRIKKITNYTTANEIAYEKNYSYGSGATEITPSEEYCINTSLMDFNNPWARRVIMTENPSIDYSPQGSPIGYGWVSESDNNGSIVYTYDNEPAYTYEEINYPAGMYSSSPPNRMYYKTFANNYKPWVYGNLTSKEIVGSTGGQSEVYEYEDYSLGTIRDFLMERWITPECKINTTNQNCPHIISSYDKITSMIGRNVFNFADRYYHSGGRRIKKTTNAYYDYVTLTEVVTTKEYFYENSQYPSIATKIISKNSKGETITSTLKHSFDFIGTPVYDEMVIRNMVASVLEQTETNTSLSKELSKAKINYSTWHNNSLILPSTIQKSNLGNSLETEAMISDYDNRGNMLQATGKDGIVTSYIWGYGQKYPVAKILNKTYADIVNQSGINLSIINNSATTDGDMRTELNKLRTVANCFVTTYTYKSLIGITSETDPNGRTIYYEYDNFNRLILIRDKDNNILKKICYNYSGQTTACNIYYNAAASQSFTRNNCSSGYLGSTVTYTVPVNIYMSTISQADADAKAQADITANGQAYANANGTCTPPGCTYTNCEWTAPNKHCVNGVCQTGWKIFTGYYFDVSIHKWVCTYHWEWSDGAWSQDYTELHDQQWDCSVSES